MTLQQAAARIQAARDVALAANEPEALRQQAERDARRQGRQLGTQWAYTLASEGEVDALTDHYPMLDEPAPAAVLARAFSVLGVERALAEDARFRTSFVLSAMSAMNEIRDALDARGE